MQTRGNKIDPPKDGFAAANNCQSGSDSFARHHIGPTDDEAAQMLREVGFENLDALIDATVPKNIRLDRQLDLPEAKSESEALADPSAVEQVLFNLVDNACKYAADAQDKSLRLTVSKKSPSARQIEIRLVDRGPGVAPAAQRRLFQAFRKSAQDAAHSAPGVGLGLALCRRLARELGGDLRYEPTADGACFVLSLRAAS